MKYCAFKILFSLSEDKREKPRDRNNEDILFVEALCVTTHARIETYIFTNRLEYCLYKEVYFSLLTTGLQV